MRLQPQFKIDCCFAIERLSHKDERASRCNERESNNRKTETPLQVIDGIVMEKNLKMKPYRFLLIKQRENRIPPLTLIVMGSKMFKIPWGEGLKPKSFTSKDKAGLAILRQKGQMANRVKRVGNQAKQIGPIHILCTSSSKYVVLLLLGNCLGYGRGQTIRNS